MHLDIDEDYIRLIATAAALVIAVATVVDAMTNGMLKTAEHLAITLAAFVLWRLTLGRAVRGRRRPAPAAPDDTADTDSES